VTYEWEKDGRGKDIEAEAEREREREGKTVIMTERDAVIMTVTATEMATDS
jgi:hypothetical protein